MIGDEELGIFERAGGILQLLAALDEGAIDGRLARCVRETLKILLQLADERSAIVAGFAHGAIESGVRIFGFLRCGLGRLRGRLRGFRGGRRRSRRIGRRWARILRETWRSRE